MPLAVGLALAWFDLISSEPFERLSYAFSYARGHIEQTLWTQAQVTEFMQRAWLNHLPELLWQAIMPAGLAVGWLCAQRYWRWRRTTRV
jgi:hypothetical protein